MLAGVEKYERPRGLGAARRLLRRPGAFALAGGTSFVFTRPKNLHCLVDLSALPYRQVHSTARGLKIGSLSTLSDLTHHPLCASEYGGIVKQAAESIATISLRNLITVGGSLMVPYKWTVLPPVFLALDARILIRGERNRRLPAREFFTLPRPLKAGDIIQGVELSSTRRCWFWFHKFSYTHTSFPLVTVAMKIRQSRGRIKHLTLALGSLRNLPLLFENPGLSENPEEITPALIDRILRSVEQQLQPMADFRASKEYRIQLTLALLREALEEFTHAH